MLDSEPQHTDATAEVPVNWAGRSRGGVVLLPCEIHTAAVRRFYRRQFEQLSAWLRGLERARHLRDVPAGLVEAAEEAIAAQAKEALAQCRDVEAHLARVADPAGLADVLIHYRNAAGLTVPIVHPLAVACLDVMLAADGSFATVERLWLLGRLHTRDRRAHETCLREAMQSVASAIRAQYSAMARVIRGDPARNAPAGDAASPFGQADGFAGAPPSASPGTVERSS